MTPSTTSNRSSPRWLTAVLVLLAVMILPIGVAHAQAPDYEAVGKRLMEAVRAGELSPCQAQAMMGELARARFAEQMDRGGQSKPDVDLKAHFKRLRVGEEMGRRILGALKESGLEKAQFEPALTCIIKVADEMTAEGESFELDPAYRDYLMHKSRFTQEQYELVIGLARRVAHGMRQASHEREGAARPVPTREEMGRVREEIWAAVKAGKISEEDARKRWKGYLEHVRGSKTSERKRQTDEHRRQADERKRQTEERKRRTKEGKRRTEEP